MYTVSPKKVRHYIFEDNLNKNCPIAIIFGILVTQTIGHRKVVSFFPPHLVCATILPWRTQNTKIHIFCNMQHVIFRERNWITFFKPTFHQLFVCSKSRPCARTHVLSLFLHSLTAESMTFCCRPFQTSMRRWFSSSTIFKQHPQRH